MELLVCFIFPQQLLKIHTMTVTFLLPEIYAKAHLTTSQYELGLYFHLSEELSFKPYLTPKRFVFLLSSLVGTRLSGRGGRATLAAN